MFPVADSVLADNLRRSGSTPSQTERFFRALLERSSELTCVIDAEGRLKYATPAFSRLLGYEHDSIVGAHSIAFVAPVDAERIGAVLAGLLAQPGSTASAVYDVLHVNGSTRRVKAVAQNLLHDDAVHGIVVNAQDVTGEAQAQAALRDSESRFANIARNLPGMVYRYVYVPDGPGRYTYVSDAARRLFGVEPDAVLRDPSRLLGLIHPEDRESFIGAVRVANTAFTPFRWEGRIYTATGEERYVQVVAQADLQADGTIISDGVVSDVTELHRASVRLQESEEQYRSLFEQNPDAVYRLDLQGRFVDANEACERLAVAPKGALLGKHFDNVVVPEDLHIATEAFRAALEGRAVSYELRVRQPGARSVRLALTKLPIIVNGRVVGVFGIAKDRTVQLALEEQLRHAQKLEAVGRLAGGVAHDFNNMLTVILSFTDLALSSLPEDALATADLQEVQSAAHRAAGLTRQLLAFGRRQMLQPRCLDPNSTIEGIARMLDRTIGEDVTLALELDPNAWTVRADPGQLEQVLMNLALNARDAMPDGGRLTVATKNHIVSHASTDRPGLLPGEYVAFSVEDTGHGIAPSALPHIFEPFFTTKPLGEGSGLGLATVYGIVKQSGGFVYADTIQGKGTRFTVLLPRMGDESPEPLAR